MTYTVTIFNGAYPLSYVAERPYQIYECLMRVMTRLDSVRMDPDKLMKAVVQMADGDIEEFSGCGFEVNAERIDEFGNHGKNRVPGSDTGCDSTC